MGVLDESRFVERMKFFDGQRLFAADLQGLEAFNREMRWLHNQSLHQPGIGRGYAVSGAKGDRQVTVGPGYAIDADGREIVLTQPQVIQVPPVSSDENGRSIFFDLTVAYQNADLEEVEFREGLCDTRGAVRLREAPVFCWVRLERDDAGNLHPATRFVRDIQEGRKIILARVEVLNCQLEQVISIAQRQSALPECGPHIACGTADPTGWEEVDLEPVFGTHQNNFFVLQANIDTTAADFEVTPCYSAHIPGPRLIKIEIDEGENLNGLLIDFLRILDARPEQFTVFLIVSLTAVSGGEVFLSLAREPGGEAGPPQEEDPTLRKVVAWVKENWRVTWMGVEG